MDKGKTFVGQSILAQIISCIPKTELQLIGKAHQSEPLLHHPQKI